MAGLAIGAIGAVGGSGSGGLGNLAELYRNAVLGDQASMATLRGATGTGIGAGTVTTAPSSSGSDFAGVLGKSISGLESLDRTAAGKAVQAATGDLSDIQDYVIAATQAQLAAQLTTTVRNKAVDAFNEIMRMPL